MFGLSFTHLVILAVLILVFVGPEQLPEVARTIARLLNEWKRATGDIQSHLTNTLREDFNVNRMLDPKKMDAAPPAPMPEVKPADHIATAEAATVVPQGPTIITDENAPAPVNTGHTEATVGEPDPVLPAGHKSSGDSHS